MYWILAVISVYILGKPVCNYLNRLRKQRIFDKWTTKSKGKIVLHGMYGNSKYLPSVSPFVLKLETYLRFAKLPYEVDKVDIWGPKDKTPWVSYDGQLLADSQFIIELLARDKQNQDDTRDTLSKNDHAIGTMARVMVEEHLYWTGIMWRFAFGGKDTFQHVKAGERTFMHWIIFSMIAPSMRSMAWSQGVGRHSEAGVVALILQDLRSISTILGKKKFILGDNPTEYDCSIFGGLASAVFMPDSPVRDNLQREFENLKDYCERMRDLFWPDWEATIAKSKTN